MKALAVIILFSFAFCTLTISCRKHSTGVTGGGKGGTGTILVTPSHYISDTSNNFVDSCTVYIKYGTIDAPADGIYDDSQKCVLAVNDTPVAAFDSLKVGLYYLYGKGYHTPYHVYVEGAAHYTMNTEQVARVYLPTYGYNP